MTFQFKENEIEYEEKGQKLMLFLTSLLLFAFGFLFLVIILPNTANGSKAHTYMLGGGLISIVVGIGTLVYSILYKEKIYVFKPDIVQVLIKKTREVTKEFPADQLGSVLKVVTWKEYNKGQPAISSIDYLFTFGSNLLPFNPSVSNQEKLQMSNQFDQWVINTYKIEISVQNKYETNQ